VRCDDCQAPAVTGYVYCGPCLDYRRDELRLAVHEGHYGFPAVELLLLARTVFA